MTLDALVPLLRCPSCAEPLALARVPQRDAEAGDCGTLRCACTTYPVLDGVPILRAGRLDHRSIGDDRVMVEGDDVDRIVRDIAAGRGLDALVRLLATPFCPWPLNRLGAARRLSLAGPIRAATLAVRRRRVRRMLARRADLTAEDWMGAFYWHAPVALDPFNYFFFRLGQPRHLTTLALAHALPASDAPVLDLACGFGHVLHAVTAGGRAAVGLDQNAHQAWLARHYVAPGAAFVCADADAPLPFARDAFGATMCCDAFHYVADKAAALAEMRRVTRGPLVLATVGNAAVDPPEGRELDAGGYAALLAGTRWRVTTETDLLVRYLDGRAPDLTENAPSEAVADEKWLSYVVADEADADALFRDHGRFGAWPHAAGDEQINPLYDIADGRLTRRFPSRWYAFENRRMADYTPREVARDAPAGTLRAGAVLVGMPPRYARPAGRLQTFRANRALDALAGRLRGG